MSKSLKQILICSAIALVASNPANASISASLKNVCDQTVISSAKGQESATSSKGAYSTLLSSHFSATSCNGQQLLKQARLDKAEKSALEDEQAELVRSSD